MSSTKVAETRMVWETEFRSQELTRRHLSTDGSEIGLVNEGAVGLNNLHRLLIARGSAFNGSSLTLCIHITSEVPPVPIRSGNESGHRDSMLE